MTKEISRVSGSLADRIERRGSRKVAGKTISPGGRTRPVSCSHQAVVSHRE